MNVIAVDFDGTARVHPDRVNALYEDEQNFIVIYTARSPLLRQTTVQQLDEAGIRYHALVMGKLRADVYIDDRNCGGLQWPKA